MRRREVRDRPRPALRLIPGTADPRNVSEPVPPCQADVDVQLLIFAAGGTVLTEAYIAEVTGLGPDAWEIRAVVSGPRNCFALAPLSPPPPAHGSAGPRLCPPSERGQSPDRSTRPGHPTGPASAGRPSPSGSTHGKDES